MEIKESSSLDNLWKALLTLILLTYALVGAKSILIPIVFSAFLTIILDPIVSFLEKKKFPTWLSILVTLIIVILLIMGGAYFVGAQAKSLLNDMPNLVDKYNAFLDRL